MQSLEELSTNYRKQTFTLENELIKYYHKFLPAHRTKCVIKFLQLKYLLFACWRSHRSFGERKESRSFNQKTNIWFLYHSPISFFDQPKIKKEKKKRERKANKRKLFLFISIIKFRSPYSLVHLLIFSPSLCCLLRRSTKENRNENVLLNFTIYFWCALLHSIDSIIICYWAY